jgi:hypothetical protein
MKQRFLVLLITGILLILGWTIIEYLLQGLIQYQYKQVVKYPVTVYSWDTELMKQLQSELLMHKFVEKVEYTSSEESRNVMIEKYKLDNPDDILQSDALPQLLRIYIKGSAKAREQKLIIKDKLDKLPDKNRLMVEYQDEIWNATFKRVDQWNQIRWILIGFLGLVIFLVFLLKRLHYEHYAARIRHQTETKLVNDLHAHDFYWANTALLSLLPVGISFFLYEIAYTSEWLTYVMDWYFFLIQLGVVLLAAVIAYPFVIRYKHEKYIPKAAGDKVSA